MATESDLDRLPTATKSFAGETVPVIDLNGSPERCVTDEALREAIATACAEWGFFQIVGHGIDRRLIDEVWRETKRFFGAAIGEKETILRTRENPWGYYNNELTKNQRDKKEVFDFTVSGVDPIYQAENRWPAMDAFRATMEAYRTACEAVAMSLLRLIAGGLNAPTDALTQHFELSHTGFVRLNYYPVADPLQGRKDVPHLDEADLGVHHHTDAGVLTVLLQDEVGGLQVLRNGFWHDVEPVDGALVINTGDMLQVWSNDRYRAAMHRVLAMQTVDRYSIPFFFNPSAGTIVKPLRNSAEEARYRPIDWAEYRGKRTDGDYADYGTEVQISQYRV